MGNIIYTEGEAHILKAYFQGDPLAFGPFYVGLGSGGIVYDEDATLSDVAAREISGNTYERQLITRDDTVTGWELRGDVIVSPELIFSNTSYDCWKEIDFAFLSLSPQGTSGDTTLIAAVQFAHTLQVKPGKSLRLVFRFKASTLFTEIVDLRQANASLVGEATILPVIGRVTFTPTASATASATVLAEGDVI